MTLRILVDECFLDKIFVAKLRSAGHDVELVTDVNLTGKPDEIVFAHAIDQDRTVITYNFADFKSLAASLADSGQSHPGILVVHQTNIRSKDMSADEIVRAIANLESSGIDLKNQIISLVNFLY